MSTHISLQGVSLEFSVNQGVPDSLKEMVLGSLFRRRKGRGGHKFHALKNLSLEISAGDHLGIIGLNGAGKSTLLKTIAGIYPPASGRILVRGKVTPLIELGVGFDVELTGRENIFVSCSLLGLTNRQIQSIEPDIVAFAELEEFIDTPVKYYSSGMYGRLAFSIATVIEPEILLVDEVFASGDAYFVNKATNRMQSLLKGSQIVVFVSHSLEQIVNLCNRAIVLHKGEIAGDGKPQEIVDYYMTELVNAPR